MHLENMSDEDKKAAECEVEFLRVLTGPTIIKLEEAWLENYKIHMVMEYAEGGNLADLLLKNRVVGRKFSSDQIMMYAAQLTLALLAIHSNSILHRDVKTQNVYIKDGVLKLGGFGIAKALASESDMAEANVEHRIICLQKSARAYLMTPKSMFGHLELSSLSSSLFESHSTVTISTVSSTTSSTGLWTHFQMRLEATSSCCIGSPHQG